MRFSVRTLLVVIAVSAMGGAAIRYGTWQWANVWVTTVLAIHLAALLGIRNRSGASREFLVGFAVFGLTYLALSAVSPLNEWDLVGHVLAK